MRVAELLMRLMMLIGLLLLEVEASSAAQPWPDVRVINKPGCQDKCGNVSIPYPFGTSEDCYHEEQFRITCNNSFHPPKAFLMESNIEVTSISIDGKLRIVQFIGYDCYDESGEHSSDYQPSLNLSKFIISDTENKFVAVGCDTQAFIEGYQANQVPVAFICGRTADAFPSCVQSGIKEKSTYSNRYTTGCIAKCGSIDYVANYSCSGLGCCQTSIPKGMTNFTITVSSYNNHTDVLDFNPCSYAFVVEESKFNFSSIYLSNLKNVQLPAVLDWSIGNETCEMVQNKSMKIESACKGNSTCYDLENGPGYRCKCNEGYDRNPYLGCLDIDECKDPNLNECINTTICKNTDGSYICSCPFGYHGDGRKSGDRCLDIDECEHPNLNDCIHNFFCKNTEGNYTCSCPMDTMGMEEKMEMVAFLTDQK